MSVVSVDSVVNGLGSGNLMYSLILCQVLPYEMVVWEKEALSNPGLLGVICRVFF